MENPLSQARHDLRGRINALKLCVSALEICKSPEEIIEFLDMTERSADKVVAASEEMERVYDQHGGWSADGGAIHG